MTGAGRPLLRYAAGPRSLQPGHHGPAPCRNALADPKRSARTVGELGNLPFIALGALATRCAGHEHPTPRTCCCTRLGLRGQRSGGGKRLASAHCLGGKASAAKPAGPMARPVALEWRATHCVNGPVGGSTGPSASESSSAHLHGWTADPADAQRAHASWHRDCGAVLGSDGNDANAVLHLSDAGRTRQHHRRPLPSSVLQEKTGSG